MPFAIKNRTRFVIFALLLLYATTADFMATTAGMVAERDCDHPTLRVEHKCVTSSVRVNAGVQHLALAAVPVSLLFVPAIQNRVREISAFGVVVTHALSTCAPALPLRR
jgi:hypothetical protein